MKFESSTLIHLFSERVRQPVHPFWLPDLVWYICILPVLMGFMRERTAKVTATFGMVSFLWIIVLMHFSALDASLSYIEYRIAETESQNIPSWKDYWVQLLCEWYIQRSNPEAWNYWHHALTKWAIALSVLPSPQHSVTFISSLCKEGALTFFFHVLNSCCLMELPLGFSCGMGERKKNYDFCTTGLMSKVVCLSQICTPVSIERCAPE